MNALLTWLSSADVVERLGWVLVHSLWQFALVALAAGAAVRAMRRSSAAMRYSVLVVAMGCLVAAPSATWWRLTDDGPRGAGGAALANDRENPAPTAVHAGLSDVPETRSEIPSQATATRPRERLWSEQTKRVMRPWLAWIVGAWGLGVVLCSVRPLLGWRTLRRLQRVGVSPVPDDALAALDRASERLGLRRAVRLLRSTLAPAPIVLGHFRPVILLPVSLVTSLPATQLEAILAHELAHVRRHDFAVNLLQTLLETLFFYHPAVWWLSRRIRVEREHCCDDFVVRMLDNRVEYGRALVAIEQLRGQDLVLALGAADGSLLSRVRRIVAGDAHACATRPGDRWPAPLLCLACLAVVLALPITLNLAARAEGEGKGEGVPPISNDPSGVHDDPVPIGASPLPAPPSSPPPGLEFLKPYPRLHGLSLDMSEKDFLRIVKEKGLKMRKTADGEEFEFRIALGDDHTLIVMFRQDGTCRGIQRIRGEDPADAPVSLADLVRAFNAQNKELEQGLDQPPLTEDEVVAAIQRSDWDLWRTRGAATTGDWMPGDRDRTAREFAVFKSIAATRQLPQAAYFAAWTHEHPDTFVVNHFWSIQLFLPSLDGDGFDGFAIRHTHLREEQVNPGSVAWGPPDKDGLSLGAYLSPRKNAYALGERVRLLLFVCNVGDKNVEVVWANTTHPGADDFAVTDDKGAKVAVRPGHDDWLIPWISGFIGGSEFGPGDVHRLEVPYEIGIGGDGSNQRVGRVIGARVGQTLQLKVSSPNGNAARTAADPSPVSGVITFKVAALDGPPQN
jgi:beta-lactamase regulating signal transducer with metallopeptidase domain